MQNIPAAADGAFTPYYHPRSPGAVVDLAGQHHTTLTVHTGPGTTQYLFVWHVKSCRPGYHAAKAYRFVHLNNTSVGELVRQ